MRSAARVSPERPRPSIPTLKASRITGGAVLLVPAKTGCYRFGLVALGVPFWPLKYATHIGDSSMRREFRHLITPPFSQEIPRQSLCTSGPQLARRATSVCVFAEDGAPPGAGRPATAGAAAMGGGGAGAGVTLARISPSAAFNLAISRTIRS